MNEILMCPPTYYTVDYEINPWMDTRDKPDKQKAATQWEKFYDLLSKLSVKIYKIEPQPGLPDMVFAANAGIVFDKKFIVSNFRFPQRQKEANFSVLWFKNKGYEIFSLPEKNLFEGEGDALMIADTLIAGFKYRSDIYSHRLIGEIMGKEVISVELINSSFYHLDTCFCPLSQETAMYYPGAFDDYGQKALNHLIPNLIRVSEKDAMNFCCNAVVSGKNIILNKCSNELKSRLENLGLNVYCLDFDEFIKAGGSSKCLVLYL